VEESFFESINRFFGGVSSLFKPHPEQYRRTNIRCAGYDSIGMAIVQCLYVVFPRAETAQYATERPSHLDGSSWMKKLHRS
jgi:hypothetical protein